MRVLPECVCSHTVTHDERERSGVARGVGQILPRVQFDTAVFLSVTGDSAEFRGQRSQKARGERIQLAVCKFVGAASAQLQRSRGGREEVVRFHLVPPRVSSPSRAAVQNDRLIQLTYSEDEDIVDREDFAVKRPNVRRSPSAVCVRACVCLCVFIHACCVCTCTRELCLSMPLSHLHCAAHHIEVPSEF